MCAKAIIFFFKKVDELFGSKCIGIYILFFPQQVMSYLHWEVRHSLISIFAGFDLPGFIILPYPFITPFLRYCFGGFSLGPHINSVNQAPFYSTPSIFAVLRNLVQEIWLEKSSLRIVVDQKKSWFYTINLPFFWFEKSGWPEKKSEFAKPLF